MTAPSPSSPRRHLRARGEEGPQRTTMVELFFDLVYVFAITQRTAVVFRAETIAVIDHNRQMGEIAAPAARVDEVLAEHDEVGRGSLGVTLNLTCARRVQTAVALISESRDQELYGCQALAASP